SKSEELPIPAGAEETLRAALLQGSHPEGLAGIVALPGGPMMVAAQAIRTTQGAGPSRGWLIMGRWLDASRIERLGSTTLLSVSSQPAGPAGLAADFRAARAQLQGSTPLVVRPLGSDTIAGYTLLRDLEGKPALLLRVDAPRRVYAEGRRSVKYYLISILAVGAIFGALTLLLLEKNVLARLARLSESVLRIGLKGDPSERVSMNGDDELTVLAASINRTLENLEDAHRRRRESEDRLGVLFRNLHIGLIVWGADGRATLSNGAALEMLGLTPEELTSRTCSDGGWQIVGEDGSPLTAADRPASRALRTRQPVRDVMMGIYRRRSDDWVWLLASAEPQMAEDGSIRNVVCTLNDITARCRAEEALRESEQRTRIIVDTALDAVVTADESGRVTGWNRRAEEMLGWPREEALGRPWVELVIPARFRGECERRYQRFLTTGDHPAANRRSELLALRRDGSEFPAELSIAPARAGGRWILSGFLRDVTERKRAEAELLKAKEAAEAASQAKSEFLANVSHEIRTPMNGIIGMTELALDGPLSEEQREYLTMAKSSADSLLAVINDILDFSKIEAGKLSLSESAFDLRQCLDEAVKPLVFRARAKSLGWTCEVAGEVPKAVVGDPTRLRQIIINLVANAIKFTDRGHVGLRVELDSQDDAGLRLRFSVSDTGIGIPLEKQKLIFEAFSQADSSTSRKYGGTGLGLTICARLAEMMGGEIGLESEAGRGATIHFTARFGVASAAAEASLDAGAPSADEPAAAGVPKSFAPIGPPLRILLAEDNPVNQKIAQRWIEAQGHAVELVGNGRDVVDRVSLEAFDLVLMDVQMPIMDGVEATTAIRFREVATGRHLPIVAVTAHAMPGDREKYLALGMDGYLAKPIRRERLLAVIEEFCAKPGRQAASAAAAAPAVHSGPDAAPEPSPTSGLEVLDLPAALARVEGDFDLLRELGAIFLENREAMLAELHRALECGDAQGVERAAHALSGTLGNFAADQACHEASSLERLARQGKLAEAAGSGHRLDVAVERLRVFMVERLVTPASALSAK
ncbi:MAG TPA: PAS domain S-box protein, partial [Terriglobia bacterium]|nr:PAS domain S-box protein [Terriglobia bacterium]